MAHETSDVDLSRLSAEQVKQLEDELTGLIGGERSTSSERIATMATQGHGSHFNQVAKMMEEVKAPVKTA